jgi:hypothetical protein
MIDWLVNRIFSWKPLYEAVTAEVHMYDQIKEILDDEEGMKIGSSFWNDGDGWRSWTHSTERNKYYFNDIPVESIGEAIEYSIQSTGPEFDMDEVW